MKSLFRVYLLQGAIALVVATPALPRSGSSAGKGGKGRPGASSGGYSTY